MMKMPNDQQLDNWLVQADQALHAEPEHPVSIQDVQRRASRNREIRQARRKAVVGMAIVATLLGGWMFLAPSPVDGPGRNGVEVAQFDGPNEVIEEIDLAKIQAQSKQVEQQIELLKLERRIQRLQRQARVTLKQSRSPEFIYQQNRDSRIAFESILAGQQENLSENKLWKLEALVEGFPDTLASDDARVILARHNKSM